MLAQLLNGFWGFELSPHASKVNTFQTEPFPQFPSIPFCINNILCFLMFLSTTIKLFSEWCPFPFRLEAILGQR